MTNKAIKKNKLNRVYVLSGLFLGLLLLAFPAAQSNVVLCVVLLLFAFLLLMSLMFEVRRVVSVLATCLFIGFSLAVTIFLKFGLVSIVFCFVLTLSGVLIQYYHTACVQSVRGILKNKKKVIEEKNSLKYQHEVKGESLNGLERRVDEIFKLFEVAKEFNECISFNQIGRILTEKVFYDLPFKNGFLLTLEGRKKKSIYKMFSFSERNWEKVSDIGHYDPKSLIELLQHNKRILQITEESLQSFAFITGNVYDLPIWIFPLLVEDKMIAILILEGAREEDFSKFSIIAAQLALQVKKINLYNTVKELSITDGLTGVFVRRHFIERFNEELKRSIRHKYHLSVLMLDIDHFKSYNDTFGHLVGDVTLREVSRIIKENVRKVDLIARYGGEEFALVLPETTKMGGLEAAERIRLAVCKEKFRVYDEETRVTVSIGFSTFPDDVLEHHDEFRDDLALELLQKADQALYQAKAQGRDRVVEYRPKST